MQPQDMAPAPFDGQHRSKALSCVAKASATSHLRLRKKKRRSKNGLLEDQKHARTQPKYY